MRIYHHHKPAQPSPSFRFEYAGLLENGHARFLTGELELLLTFRGTGMIDVFERSNWAHIAFLDFDIQREIHLNSAFGTPLIGLPFSVALRQTHGVSLNRYNDLRQGHHYGFFVEPDYRNKGRIGIWNLDELMLAIALAYAEDHHLQWFHIKPTGDTASYYRRKYGATPLSTATENMLSIRLGDARTPYPHVHPALQDDRTCYINVQTFPDDSWSSG